MRSRIGPHTCSVTAGVDGALEHHDRPFGHRGADGLAGGGYRAEIGLGRDIDRCRHGNDVHIRAGNRRRVRRGLERRGLEHRRIDLAGRIAAVPELGDSRRVVIEPDNVEMA